MEPEGPRYPVTPPGRNFHSKRLLDRHGYYRHVALWKTARGPGCDSISLPLFGHDGKLQGNEVSRGHYEYSSLVGLCSDRAKNASESTQERQDILDRVSLYRASLAVLANRSGVRG